jgi:hypothetical protein
MVALLALAALALAACRSKAWSQVFPPPEARCLRTWSDAHDNLADALEDSLAGQNLADKDGAGVMAVFRRAAREAGIRKANPQLALPEGDGTYLAVVDWCGTNWSWQIYVIDRSGDVTYVGETEVLSGLINIQWLDETWVVITNASPGEYVIHLRLIAQRDGEWAQIYPSVGGPAVEPLMLRAKNWPVFTFEDGYERLIVAVLQDDGSTLETIYAWQDDHYELVEERTRGE